jgi:hypothetical protein
MNDTSRSYTETTSTMAMDIKRTNLSLTFMKKEALLLSFSLNYKQILLIYFYYHKTEKPYYFPVTETLEK